MAHNYILCTDRDVVRVLYPKNRCCLAFIPITERLIISIYHNTKNDPKRRLAKIGMHGKDKK